MLKARVKQLQASNVPEVMVNKVELAPLGNDKYQDPLQKVVAPSPAEDQLTPRGRDESPAQPRSWVEKLKKEMYIRQLKVERKLSIAASKLALEGQAKAKPKGKVKAKAKATKQLKNPKAKVAAAWSQSHVGPHGVYAHSKPRVAAAKKVAKVQRSQRVREGKDSSQYKILQQTIQSNLECFLFLQQPEEAERFLLLYHSSPVKRRLLNVNAYNIVMRSWARKVPSWGLLPWSGCQVFWVGEGGLAQEEEPHTCRSSGHGFICVCHICLQQASKESLASAEGDGADRKPPNQAADPCEVALRGGRGWGRMDVPKFGQEQRGVKL